MKDVYVAVMDYCSCSIKMHKFRLGEDWQTEDVEDCLNSCTDYKDDQCYYMASEKPIEVIQ